MKHNYVIFMISCVAAFATGTQAKAFTNPDFLLYQNNSMMDLQEVSEELNSDMLYVEEVMIESNQDLEEENGRQIKMENGRDYVIIRINNPANFNKLTATFWDMTGKQIMVVALNNSDNLISTEKLRRGIYCLRVEEQGNPLHVFKIIKQ